MPLVDESEEDRKLATLIKYKSVESYDERQARKRKAIEEASVGGLCQSRPSWLIPGTPEVCPSSLIVLYPLTLFLQYSKSIFSL